MLDIFKLKTNNKKKELYIKQQFDNYLWNNRYYPSANREWLNSVYFYNNKNNILLPNIDIVATKIIKSYFNMYNRYMEKRIKIPFIKKWKKRFNTRRFWIAKGTVKHTSDKVVVTLFLYNRQHNYLINKLNKLKKKLFFNFNIYKPMSTYKQDINKFNYIVSFFNLKNSESLKKISFILGNKINNYKFNIKIYVNNLFKKYIKKCLKKEIFYLRYKQIILFNKFKFNNNLLLPLKKLLKTIYNKKVEFNIITLKYYYLNSDIMSQIIITKLRKRSNRILRVLKSCLRNIKTPNINNINVVRERNKVIGIYNETITKFLITNSGLYNNRDTINKFLNIKYVDSSISDKQKIIIDNIKHKILSGVRIQGSGRLTKRITASRSIYKLKYVGKLKNIDSTYKGLSTVMLRGNKKSNIQYTLLKNRTKIGAYGIKGWIAGY